MRLSPIIGVIGAFAVIIYVNNSEGDPLGALMNVEAAVIVLGGCFMAVLNHFQFQGFKSAVKGLKWLIKPPTYDAVAFIDQLTEWTRVSRREGLLSLENELDGIEDDPFLQEGLQMVIDGVEPANIRALMHTRMETDEMEDSLPAEVWEAIGGYAPTLGVLGAVMGLIHVMLHLNGNGKNIGAGIAAAFVATMYGVGSANLIFIPIGKRLSKVVDDRVRNREMVIEGMVLLGEGTNPQTIRTRLQGYINREGAAKDREESESEAADEQA